MPKRMISFAIEQDVYEDLIAWKEKDGINVSEQLRRAVIAWVQQNAPKELRGGAKKKTKRKK